VRSRVAQDPERRRSRHNLDQVITIPQLGEAHFTVGCDTNQCCRIELNFRAGPIIRQHVIAGHQGLVQFRFDEFASISTAHGHVAA
jgi:hypothetical protein